MANQVLLPKSEAFALRIVKLYQHLCELKHEFVLAKQILRSGTSIGANIAEGVYAQSAADFITKYRISLKEASETAYWLRLLHNSEYITDSEFDSIYKDCDELIRMLVSSLKKLENS